MGLLSQSQKDAFWKDGVLVVEDAVSDTQLEQLRSVFTGWVEESRSHTEDYGETLDGRARFDPQPGHSADQPGLRRIQSPEEVSDVYEDVMRTARVVDYCTELIGPNIRFHHGKVNSKLPGSGTAVKWHQDFLFQPMTNDDMITCLLFIDDVTAENGPLEVIPGSHKGPLYPHWHDGVFTGAVDDSIVDPQRDRIQLHRQGWIGLPDACEPASRFDTKRDRPAAHALHHNLLCRGRAGAEPQSPAKPLHA